MDSKLVRRLSLALVVPLALLAAGCGSSSDDTKGSSKDLGSVTIVGQKFPEADIMAELYKGLLDHAGFKASVKELGGRDLYLDPLQKGDVQVSTDYLSSMTEALNRKANGDNAKVVASHDTAATLLELTKLAGKYGMSALKPAQAQDANAFAVTKKYADENNLKTLSDLAALGKSIKLGAAPDCDKRPDCKIGLEKTYGLKISSVVPTGFGTDETKADLKSGATQLGQVGTSDGTLTNAGLVLLEDDKGLQNAENLVPIANTAWLKGHQEAVAALDSLSQVLTTDDLAAMIAQVSVGREKAADVADAYLKAKGLV
ncbi:MAG: ABC transporter substrate-binding protein [Marmoricola sp.]